jgi:lactoylglutathione lyase
MQKLLKIDNIMYCVSDLKKAEAFYRDALGLKKIWEDQKARMIGFSFAEQRGSELVIHSNPDLPKFDYSYIVQDVVKFCEEFKKLGHKVVREPIDVRPGKYAILSDPDGNEIPIIDLTKFGNKPKYD